MVIKLGSRRVLGISYGDLLAVEVDLGRDGVDERIHQAQRLLDALD